MKELSYWDINIRNRFYRSLEDLGFLQRGFKFLQDTYVDDPDFSVIVQNVDVIVDSLQASLDLYLSMIKR